MKEIKTLLDEYFRDRIDDCSDHPIPISKFDLVEALNELRSYNDDDSQAAIEILEKVIAILNENNIPMKEVIYQVKF